jgi:hypothetical protein
VSIHYSTTERKNQKQIKTSVSRRFNVAGSDGESVRWPRLSWNVYVGTVIVS